MAARLIGGPALRARLQAIKDIPANYAAMWADDAAGRIKHSAPPSKRSESKKWTTRATRTRGGVYGAFWWIFVDRGTKAHDIAPRKRTVLRFSHGDETIFAGRTHHPRIARRPFISRGAQDALAASEFADTVVQTWNGRRLRGRKRFL